MSTHLMFTRPKTLAGGGHRRRAAQRPVTAQLAARPLSEIGGCRTRV
jgi:hypothetical protein